MTSCSWRVVLAVSFCLMFTSYIAAADKSPSKQPPLEPMPFEWRKKIVPDRGMSSLAPAEKWEDALVSGNGKMGVLVFARPLRERLIFNHEKFNYPQFAEPKPVPDISGALGEIRRLMLAGKYEEAFAYSIKAAREDGFGDIVWTDPYHPACAVEIEIPAGGQIRDYLRMTNFTTGEATVVWNDNRGRWRRRLFVSRPDNVVVHRIEAPPGKKLDCTFTIDEKLPEVPDDVSFRKNFSRGWFGLDGKYPEGRMHHGFEMLTRVVPDGGRVKAGENNLRITDANEILLLTRLVRYETGQEAEASKLKTDLAQIPADYDVLLKRHARIHGEIFNRVELDLGGEDCARSVEELLKDKPEDGVNAALLEKMFDMGRYVYLSSSGDWPPRLVGLWTGTWRPNWRGDFTLDANVNLAVSSGNIGNMPEAMEAYFNLIEGIADDWKVNARKLYGCCGVLSGMRTDGDHNLHTHFRSRGFCGHFWTAGAEWLILPFYEHYLVTGDREFLRKRALPLMKQVVLFYEDFLTVTDEDGNYVFVPSYSPENRPANTGCAATINATMDIAVAKEAITNLIAACEDLGVEKESIPRLRAMLQKIPPYRINQDGALAEWAWEGLKDRYNHRHLSHLYPLWPGHEINPDHTPKIFDAARRAAELRGQGNRSAHGLMHMALAATRLKDHRIVMRNLKQILEGRYIYTSMVTSHNPDRIYNVDSSCSLPAVVMEMLVYSRPSVIELLPALPEQLPAGRIGGVCCRTQAIVENLSWNLEKGTAEVTLKSKTDQNVTLILRRGIESVRAPDGVEVSPSGLGRIARRVSLPAEKSVTLKISFE